MHVNQVNRMKTLNSTYRHRIFVVLVGFLLGFTQLCAAQVQEDPVETLDRLVNQADEISQAIDGPELTARAEKLKTDLGQTRKKLNDELQEVKVQVANAQSEAENRSRQLEKLRGRSTEEIGLDGKTAAELEALQTTWRSKIESFQSQVETQRKSSGERLGERKRLQENLTENSKQVEAVETAIGKIDTTDQGPTNRLRLLELQAQKLHLSVNEQLLRQNQLLVDADARFGLSQKKLDINIQELEYAKAVESRVSEKLNEVRQLAAEKQTNEAKDVADTVREQYPELAASEEINVEIATRIETAEQQLATAQKLEVEKDGELAEVRQSFSNTRETIESLNSSASVGVMLRKRKADLPSRQKCLQQAAEARDEIDKIDLILFEVEEQLKELSASVIRREASEGGNSIDDRTWEKLDQPVKELISRRNDLLRSYETVLGSLFEYQLKVETHNTNIARVTEEFDEYINERIFWIRSNKVLFAEFLSEDQQVMDKSDFALFSPRKWLEAAAYFPKATTKYPVMICSGAIVLLILLAYRAKFRKAVDEFGRTARRGACATYWPTIRSAFLTTVIALTVPLIFVGASVAMSSIVPTGSNLFDALASAIFAAGMFAIPLEILRRICRPGGLAVCHFDWPDGAVAKLKTQLTWYVPVASLFVFSVSIFIGLSSNHGVDLIERVLFVAGMLFTTYFFYCLFHPTTGIFGHYLKRNEDSWAKHTSTVWFTLLLLVPLTLAVLAFSGYYYSAINLAICLASTFAFGLAVEVTRALVRRFVLVRRRHAHIESAKRKREAELAAERELLKKAAAERARRIESGEEVEGSTTPVMTSESLSELQFESIDIDENAGQANQLIRLAAIGAWALGLWVIWSDVLPAMKALDEYKLWGRSTFVADASPAEKTPTEGEDSEGENAKESKSADPVGPQLGALKTVETSKQPIASDQSVSLRDFVIFLAIALVTFVAARNLPSAFEMLFLKELPVDRSARFASKSLFSYAIVIVGVVLALRTLKIDWSNIQWLVTALTFGLAFGLQEIFANFVAGVILMFERPMRIGDLITVDEFTGVVTKIRTRATTVVNWDRKEYVIPNKDFITGRLINWTLSDAINRIQFTVGIAYGSDVAKAKKLIFDICKEHPSIVNDPPTSVTFEEFADSSLNLVVRTFLGEVDSRLPVIDSLHFRINSAFIEEGIEISFPQRDLHLRSVDPSFSEMHIGTKNPPE